MSFVSRGITRSIVFSGRRRMYSTSADSDIRARMLAEVKNAMKSKDSFTSTTLRSVLSEIYIADKTGDEKILSSAIVGILRKGIQRRSEAATKYAEALRPELADKEKQECELLSKFLPPQLPEEEINQKLKVIINTLPPGFHPKKALGLVFKEFYSQVDKSLVDTDFVKRQTEALIQQEQS